MEFLIVSRLSFHKNLVEILMKRESNLKLKILYFLFVYKEVACYMCGKPEFLAAFQYFEIINCTLIVSLYDSLYSLVRVNTGIISFRFNAQWGSLFGL